MGAGRKTKTLPLKERSEVSWTANSSTSARNLPRNELGAVIFGCKNHTFTECLKDKLFGLPAGHYSYVKNVSPGLTLFLFNYSDRKLHGIFEATSTGQMSIKPHAWIASEGTESTPYAAQVRVNFRMRCRPLLEEQFKPIISKNYYSERLFWFELDKEQNRRLIELFSFSPVPEKNILPRPPKAARWNNPFGALSSSNVDKDADEEFKNADSQEYSGMTETSLKGNEHSHTTIITNTDDFAPEKKWTDFFKTPSSSCIVRNVDGLESDKVGLKEKLNPSLSDCVDMDWKVSLSAEEMSKSLLSDTVVECLEELASVNSDAKEVHENKVTSFQYHERDTDWSDLTDIPYTENTRKGGDLNPSEFESVVAKEPEQDLIDTKSKLRSGNAPSPTEYFERDPNQPNLTGRPFSENINAMSGRVLMGIKSSDFESVIIELTREIEGLRVCQQKQMLKIDSLEHDLVHSKLEIEQLKRQCHKLESLSSSASYHGAVEDCQSPNITTEESVLIVGGFDGDSWLPDLSLYSPFEDHVISLCPMNFSRSYASVAKLNGELYLFGGVHDGVWYDTVESYNPLTDQWARQPSLNKKKGSLAGASVYDKIFAIGGGNGAECFSEVEVFDLHCGCWITTQSMIEKRFAPAAEVINGALYVAGGYDGNDYLRTVERFDPRECSWSSLGRMNTMRGCHSLVSFKEKLYALGGYDGDKMVPTVEVFDPRVGSWTMAEPMTLSRGYFGSFVSGGKIYVIGGLEDTKVLDVIECYDEGSGWQVTGKSAFGKRCFFSTLVL